MTRKEERALSAYLTSVDFLSQNTAITASVPYFTPAFTVFKATVKSIKDLAQQQSTQNNAIGTQSKTDLRKECFTTLRILSEVLKAHAVGINDDALAEQVSEGTSLFFKLADTTFLTTCRKYHALTTSHLADLVPFNVDAPFLASFKTSIDTYEMILTMPRLNIIARADSTKKLKDLFGKARVEIDKLTTLIKPSS